ncbi:hypothetical protein H4Q26_017064 [Puccinia striiformis f. sp. tritici PST-130]|nr:hypothetical protein H4Q26_017064 [Puccinia striiformis f. sp. tritici PST-130]
MAAHQVQQLIDQTQSLISQSQHSFSKLQTIHSEEPSPTRLNKDLLNLHHQLTGLHQQLIATGLGALPLTEEYTSTVYRPTQITSSSLSPTSNQRDAANIVIGVIQATTTQTSRD